MNDEQDLRYAAEPPEWVWDLLDKHDLANRTDCALAAATVLLKDAADLLREASLTMHREQAITMQTKYKITECAVMIADAEKLYPSCPRRPVAGRVTKGDDGTLLWSAEASKPD